MGEERRGRGAKRSWGAGEVPALTPFTPLLALSPPDNKKQEGVRLVRQNTLAHALPNARTRHALKQK